MNRVEAIIIWLARAAGKKTVRHPWWIRRAASETRTPPKRVPKQVD